MQISFFCELFRSRNHRIGTEGTLQYRKRERDRELVLRKNKSQERERERRISNGKRRKEQQSEISFNLIRGEKLRERERKREKVAWFAAGWRVCVRAIWCPRHPRKFLIKFSPLPGARPDREGRVGTPSEFFSSMLVEQRPASQSSPLFYPPFLATLGNFRLRLLLSRRSLFAAKWALF